MSGVAADWSVHTTLGRHHQEPSVRDAFELDRRRVLASSAFRRLQYKTQVFATPVEDHIRTRLTHTLEVASLARWLALGLGANATLAEVIALAHDLGHPPFGHAGERALEEQMRDHGGFEHNAQSLRVVEFLEHPFPPFRGLNLTLEVREGLATHRTAFDRPVDVHSEDPQLIDLVGRSVSPSIEAQIVEVADRLAYNAHDLEDACGAGLLTEAKLVSVPLWRDMAAPVVDRHPNSSIFAIWRPTIERLLSWLVDDVVQTTMSRLGDAGASDVEHVRSMPDGAVTFSTEAAEQLAAIEALLKSSVYGHSRVVEADGDARHIVQTLFSALVQSPDRLPKRFASRIDADSPHRVVCDYVAGMTDRYCQSLLHQIT